MVRARGRFLRAAPTVLLVAVTALALLLTTAGSASAPQRLVAAAASTEPSGAPVEALPDGVVRRTLSYGPHGDETTYDVYGPAGGPPRARPTVLLVHGGSWEIGDKVEWVERATELARSGWTAVALNYRRTPTAGWPAPLDDVRAALAHLQQHAPALGVDVDRTGALGDSVGGQLAALLGRPVPGVQPVRAVVSWSGVNDMAGLVVQGSSGGCAPDPCTRTGLARRVVEDLMGCTPAQCPQDYRDASPAAGLTRGPATLSVSAEGELIDPRQAWAIDGALSRARTASRVMVLPTGRHGRGNEAQVWDDSVRFLRAALLPETTPEFPRPDVRVTLAAPDEAVVGQPVRLSGAVRPRALGSTVALQVRGGDGRWRTVRTPSLTATPADTVFRASWTPRTAGTVVWRATWRGGGGEGTSPERVVRVRAAR